MQMRPNEKKATPKTAFAFVSAEDYKKVSPSRSKTRISGMCTLHSTTTYEIRDKNGKVIKSDDIVNADIWFDNLVIEACDYYDLNFDIYSPKLYSMFFEKSRKLESWFCLDMFEQMLWECAGEMYRNSS